MRSFSTPPSGIIPRRPLPRGNVSSQMRAGALKRSCSFWRSTLREKLHPRIANDKIESKIVLRIIKECEWTKIVKLFKILNVLSFLLLSCRVKRMDFLNFSLSLATDKFKYCELPRYFIAFAFALWRL